MALKPIQIAETQSIVDQSRDQLTNYSVRGPTIQPF